MKGFLFMGLWGGEASRGPQLSAVIFHVSHVNAGLSLSSQPFSVEMATFYFTAVLT